MMLPWQAMVLRLQSPIPEKLVSQADAVNDFAFGMAKHQHLAKAQSSDSRLLTREFLTKQLPACLAWMFWHKGDRPTLPRFPQTL